MADEADGKWMTYAELASARSISRASAARFVRRHKWRKQEDNQGNVRVFLAAPDTDPDDLPAIARAIAVLHADPSALNDQIAHERSRADAADTRADKAEIALRETEAALTAEQAARAAATARAEIAEMVLASAEAEAAALRQAEQERRARSLVGRIRAALRGE
jgi:hypothetical protein